MKRFCLFWSKSVCFLLPGFFVFADISLPLATLRNQAHTDHCWAYATSHLLESRALLRDSKRVLINVEKDVKYWVDYERMMYIYKTKNDFFLDSYEGGWQIEFWQSFLKHGKSLIAVSTIVPEVFYKPLEDFFKSLEFMPEPKKIPDSSLPSWFAVKEMLKTQMTSDQQAHDFAIDYLNRYYGIPAVTTTWEAQSIATKESAQYVLNGDYEMNHDVDSVVLIKPVTDGQLGWVQYLNYRYWGYRYDRSKVLSLIELSLDQKWPVSFDNVYHAMTILAYFTDHEGNKHYAVADSIPGKITWYAANSLLAQLNLVTFFKVAIAEMLPPKNVQTVVQLNLAVGQTIDQKDNVVFPPR